MKLTEPRAIGPLDSEYPPRLLQIRLAAYVEAMKRAEGGWSGPSLKRRRKELRTLAAKCGQDDSLELILRALREGKTPAAPERTLTG